MKRKLLFALIALFAIGLLVVGCPNDNTPGHHNPGTGPDTPFTPPSDWVGFTEEEMLAGVFYAGDGVTDKGSITKNADGTYTVTVKTVTSTDSRASFVQFGFADVEVEGEDGTMVTAPRVIFRKGWSALLTLPNNAQYNPVRIDALPSTAVAGGNPDGWPRSQNSDATGDIEATFNQYGEPIGTLSLHWGTDEVVADDYRTMVLWFVWPPMGVEEGEDYTFIINDIKVLPHDPSEPDPDPVAWTPDPVTEPAGWVDFEANDISFYPAGGSVENNLTTVKTRDDGHTEITIKSNTLYAGGYYLSVTLPDQLATSTMKPSKINSYAKHGASPIWSAESVKTKAFTWVQGRVDLYYEHEELTVFDTVVVEIHWHGDVVADQDYVITGSALKAKEVFTGSTELEPWTPPAIDPPNLTNWMDFPVDKAAAGFVPAGGSIVDKAGGGYTVTAKTRSGGQTEIALKGTDGFAFKEGYYLSMTLPTQTAESTMKPSRVYINTRTGSTDNWNSATDLQQAFKWVQGKAEGYYAHDTLTGDTIVISIYWHTGVVADQDYVFTIDALKVADEYDPSSEPPPEPWTPPALDPAPDLTGWVDFPIDTTASTFYPSGGTIVAGSTAGTYTVTAKTRSDGQTEITFKGTDAFAFGGGYYLSINLPTLTAESTMKPRNIVTRGGSGWASEIQINQQFKWVQGKVDTYYAAAEFSDQNSFVLSIYWHNDVVAGQDYTFTINSFKVATEGSSTEPELVDIFSPDNIRFVTSGASISGDQVTVKPQNNWNETAIVSEIVFEVANKVFLGGYSLSITIEPNPTVNPSSIMASGTITNEWTEPSSSVSQKTVSDPAGGATLEFSWDGNKWDGTPDTTAREMLVLDFAWPAGTTVGTDYTFTLNHVKVGSLEDAE
jgi:hypothetical protein